MLVERPINLSQRNIEYYKPKEKTMKFQIFVENRRIFIIKRKNISITSIGKKSKREFSFKNGI